MAGRQERAPDADRQLRYDTIKVRLYPTQAQQALFDRTFGCCRWIWNHMLADQERFYRETDVHFLPTPAKYKGEAPFLKDVDNQALIQEHNRLSQAFRQFFRDPSHFRHPCFKRKKDARNSYTVCNCRNSSGSTIYTTRDAIRLTKAGEVRARFHRRPQSGWELKRVTVERTRTGKYYAAILYTHVVRAPRPAQPTESTTLGLKYSSAHLYVTDSGQRGDLPRQLREAQKKLGLIQQRLSRMEPGSRNYQQQVQKYRLLHQHIADQRRDLIHKVSSRIANGWDAVCVRDADQAGRGATGWGQLLRCLAYKLERQGKPLVLVDRFAPTSRTCHSCGCLAENPPDTRHRTWSCPACGAVLDREVNAAINIKCSGLSQLSPGA